MRPHALGIFVVALLMLPYASLAQTVGGAAGPSFSISIDPQNPLPNGTATVSFLSSSLDLTNASIAVEVNGKEVYAGAIHPLSVALGKAGSVTTITATVTYLGSTYLQTATIEPQDIVLVAEPLGSAPALYPGKPDAPLGGNVRVVAMANVRTSLGAAVNPAALSYAWTVDDTKISDSSGIGKSALIVAVPLQYRSRSVSVKVTTADGALTGGASLVLTGTDPSIRLYENDPLLGVRFDRALSGTYPIPGAEASLFAAPFSFPAGTDPVVQWFLNGTLAQTGRTITLRPTGSGAGQASLSVVASSAALAKAAQNLLLSFGQNASPNLFGL